MSREHYLIFDNPSRSDCGSEAGQILWFTPVPAVPVIPHEATVIRFPVERTREPT